MKSSSYLEWICHTEDVPNGGCTDLFRKCERIVTKYDIQIMTLKLLEDDIERCLRWRIEVTFTTAFKVPTILRIINTVSVSKNAVLECILVDLEMTSLWHAEPMKVL